MPDNPLANKEEPEITNRSIVVIIIIGLIVALYYYAFPPVAHKSSLTEVTGTLALRPYHYTDTENPSYIKLWLDKNEQTFYLRKCAYANIDVDRVLTTPLGTTFRLMVNREELAEQELSLNVYGMHIDGEEYFNLDNYNYCSKRVYKLILYAVGFLALVLLLTFPFKKHLAEWRKNRQG